MRLIDADALIEEINERIEAAIKWGVNAIADGDKEIKLRAEQAVATFCEASLTAKKMPTIDPVKHGRWVMQGTAYGCSLCGEGVIHPFHNYCPNCGARMDEVTE